MNQYEKYQHFSNEKEIRNKDCVIYWMNTAQRFDYNVSLYAAEKFADNLNLPLVIIFIIDPEIIPLSNRQYEFMLNNVLKLKDHALSEHTHFFIYFGDAVKIVLNFSKTSSCIITDAVYLKEQRRRNSIIRESADCRFVEYDSNVIIPVLKTSDKEEYAASTIRRKIQTLLGDYLTLNGSHHVETSQELSIELKKSFSDNCSNHLGLADLLKMINRDFQTGLLRYYSSGIDYAKKELDAFISKKINHYHDLRNHPDEDYQSNLSPYLNFGQISPLYIASEIYKIENDNSEKFLDELIIRRELSYNFVHYNMNYDNINCLQDWAHRSLQENTVFEREYIYNLEELENAKTHDVYWNAAQNEMVLTGKMHGYMRMYWGKKILEWSRYPDEAFELALFLNNKYSLDGYNPNSYAGIAWCFGKHDRPWSERKIFGKVRYMNAAGLCRKFNMPAYLQKVTALTNL